MLTGATTFPIAIDIQEEDLYAVQLKGKQKGLAIKGLAHKKLKNTVSRDPESWEGLIPELREIRNNKAFRGKRVVMHLPAQYTHVFPVSIQVQEGGTLEEALLAESEKHLSFPIEEAVIDYPSIVQTSAGEYSTYRSIIVGAELGRLQPIVSNFKEAGLFIEAVDIDISSLIRAHQYLQRLETNFIALCHIGHQQSMLSVVNQERILMYRHTPWGVANLIKKLQEHLDLPRSQVMTILQEHGVSKTNRVNQETNKQTSDAGLMEDVRSAVVDILTPYLEDFIYEFHNLTGYAISEVPDKKIQKAYFYGQAGIIKGLDQYLEDVLHISVELVNPVDLVTCPQELRACDLPDAGGFSLAFGLAMRKVQWL